MNLAPKQKHSCQNGEIHQGRKVRDQIDPHDLGPGVRLRGPGE